MNEAEVGAPSGNPVHICLGSACRETGKWYVDGLKNRWFGQVNEAEVGAPSGNAVHICLGSACRET